MAIPKLVKVTKPIHIPSLDKDVLFEPFTIEDEKAIVTLEENSSSYHKSLVQLNILKKCCQDPTVNFDAMSIVEIAYLFLKLRGISYSDIIELEVECKKCKESVKLTMNIKDVEIDASLLKPLRLTVNTTDGNYFIIATHYTVADLEYIDVDSTNPDINSLSLVLRQMMRVDGNDIIDLTNEEKRELFSQFGIEESKKVLDYISSNSKLKYHLDFKCPHCGEEYEWDIQDFFI